MNNHKIGDVILCNSKYIKLTDVKSGLFVGEFTDETTYKKFKAKGSGSKRKPRATNQITLEETAKETTQQQKGQTATVPTEQTATEPTEQTTQNEV